MKIDIHVHTRKAKQGDSQSRNVTPERFAEVVLSTDVKIIAITNHNMFDLQQYEQILNEVDGAIQVWPGIELDVIVDKKRSHLIVITSPKRRDSFSDAVGKLIGGARPDDYVGTLEQVVECFDALAPIYIAHYQQKAPSMLDDGISRLLELTDKPRHVVKEAANSISAGIFIAHGHASIFGSDLQDWDSYPSEAQRLPELRLPVDSFEHFCLLLDKDHSAINTTIDRKRSDTLTLQPFEDDTKVIIRPFNDINVIFGPKGTGKTKILEAIAKHYSSNGVRSSVFKSAPEKLDNEYDVKGKGLTKNLNPHGIHYCTDEIRRIKSSKEIDITGLNRYRDYFQSESRSKNAQKMNIKGLHSLNESTSKNRYQTYQKSHKKILDMIQFIESDGPVSEVAGEEKIESLIAQLNELASGLKEGAWRHYLDWKGSILTNSASRCYREEVARKTGTLTKPTETGFRKFATNRLVIKRDALEVCRNILFQFSDETESIGSLGPDKGELHCTTSFQFHDGKRGDGKFHPIKDIIKKAGQAAFVTAIKKIEAAALSDNLFDAITDLNSIENVVDIESVYELLLFWRRFTLNGEVYSPSTGECSMLNLHRELSEDKDVYILDEPEKSLGNEYINDVIIPLINDKARQGKKVFISTHDANIAVRTLPYNSIYRCHDKNGHATYVGNPFSNDLVCQEDSSKKLDWKKVSMRTLEGGEAAFGERGKIYGNH